MGYSAGKAIEVQSVLVVDDEPVIAEILKMHLEDAGFRVTVAGGVEDFYRCIKAGQYTLVLLDVNMPIKNGLELLPLLINDHIYTAVIMMTGHGSEEIAIEAIKNGAIDYLTKPIDLEDMLNKVYRGIEQARKVVEFKARQAMEEESRKLLHAELSTMRMRIIELEGNSSNSVIKSIEFDEDAYQAGISILSYFSTVVKQKYPNKKVKVRIEQDDRKVRLLIETRSGDRELIEKTLEDYGLVVVGQIEPNEFLTDKIHEMQLRHKLDIALMEVKHTKDLLAFSQESKKREIVLLTEEVAHLKKQIGEAFKREAHTREVLLKIIESHSVDGEAKDAVIQLSETFERQVLEKDKELIFELLSIIKDKNRPAYEDIQAYLIASFGGATGNLLSSWLPIFFAILAK